MAPHSTIFRDTSTLPTRVRTTAEPYRAASPSMPSPEFRQVTTPAPRFRSRMCRASRRADLSPVRASPFSSQNRLLSPSPSNAIPRSAPPSRTAADRSARLSGVGSDPLPGKSPSIVSFTGTIRQSSIRHRRGAATA